MTSQPYAVEARAVVGEGVGVGAPRDIGSSELSVRLGSAGSGIGVCIVTCGSEAAPGGPAAGASPALGASETMVQFSRKLRRVRNERVDKSRRT